MKRILSPFLFFLICLAIFFGLNYLVDKISRHETAWANRTQVVEQSDILVGRPSEEKK